MALSLRYVQNNRSTEDEYFEFERTSVGRWEYVGGEIRAMAGGTDDHNAISANIGRALGNALVPRGCRVYGADMKVHTGDGVNTFPDVSVVCGPREYHWGKTDVITNPILIVEVLSDSTRDYDRTEKFDHYQTIPSLTDYLLVEQDAARVLLYTRRDDPWELQGAAGRESAIYLPSVGASLALVDVYALIEFVDEPLAL